MDDHLHGSVDRILFVSEESGFTVAFLKTPKEKEAIAIVGTMPGLQAGETLSCKGAWKYHPKFGRQFEIVTYQTELPSDLLGIQKYLESGMIGGIGPVYAKRIIDSFGPETLKIIDRFPEKLLEVEGIGRKRLDQIMQCWGEQREIRELMIFLQVQGIRPSFAQKIFRVYGINSIETIKKNPYILARTVLGIGFKSADAIAKQLQIDPKHPMRIEGGIDYVLGEAAQEGHTCLPLESLKEKAKELLEIDPESILQEIARIELERKVIISKIDEVLSVWSSSLYQAEVGIARELTRLEGQPTLIRAIDGERALDWVEERLEINLADEQKVAVLRATSEKAHIITGGPGTGKSTITRAILEISHKLSPKIILAAPTGRAAKRMTEITRFRAVTIHSLLEVDFVEGGFKKGRDDPLDCDLLIVDEASMIDTQLFYSLLKALPPHARLIIIGDVDQLPSVGCGSVLRDLIESGAIGVTRLTQIFRQAKGSKIIVNAHRINQGEFPFLDEGRDFRFIEIEEPEAIAEQIVSLVKTTIPQQFQLDSFSQIQVLSPMKKGAIGIENLNHLLQQALNPNQTPLLRMGRAFAPGDKILQLRNNYDRKVFNGDIGRIDAIDLEEKELFATFDGKEVVYPFADLDEIALAYAVSIHKYQGSESACVIIPVHTQHFKLLHRNLLYTGITRGRKLVVLVGTKKAIHIAIQTNDVDKRHTGLRYILEQTLSAKT